MLSRKTFGLTLLILNRTIKTMKIGRFTPRKFVAQAEPFKEPAKLGKLLSATLNGVLSRTIVTVRTLSPVVNQIATGVQTDCGQWLIGMRSRFIFACRSKLLGSVFVT